MDRIRAVYRIVERVIWVLAGIIVVAVAFYESRRGQDLSVVLVTLAIGVAFLIYAAMMILNEQRKR